MRSWFLSLELIDSPLLLVSAILAALLAAAMFFIRPRHPWRFLLVFVVGGLLGYGVGKLASITQFFGVELPDFAPAWAGAAFAATALGIVVLFSRPWWRRVMGVLLILFGVLAGALGVNRAFGITHTPASLLGIQVAAVMPLPALAADDGSDPASLYQTWDPPSDMPDRGRVSALGDDEHIPSGSFSAREGALYLPPAALVADPPKLPLLVFMMGQPGSPDPTVLTATLDEFAAAHNGLAPIVILADQLGSQNADPACHDSTEFGGVSTYFNTNIPEWASENLNIIQDHAYWVIGGYSNGGSCALAWGAQFPEVWGGILDISGNEYPGSQHPDRAIAELWDGDAAAFEAAKPASQFAAHPGAYAGHFAAFTWGTDDKTFGPGQQSNAALAASAGFTVSTATVKGAKHVGPALTTGLPLGIAAVAPSLGLAPPTG